MDIIQVTFYGLFFLFFSFFSVYVWFYLKRAEQSKALIGITAPRISLFLVRFTLFICIASSILILAFLAYEVIINR